MAQFATAAAVTAAETAAAATKTVAEGVYRTTQDDVSTTNNVPDELEVVVDEENPV
jgi:hypothetical protein